MKRNFLINSCGLLSGLLFIVGCSSEQREPKQATTHNHSLTDSSIHELTKPTNETVIARAKTIQGTKGMKVFPIHITGRVNYDTKDNVSLSSRVPGRLERVFVKYNFQAVQKGQLLLEVYSPELVTAQRELLLLTKSGEQKLLASAIQKLQYLGMSYDQIQTLIKRKEVSYRVPIYSPSSGYIVEKGATSTIKNTGSSTPALNSEDAMGNMGSPATSRSSSVTPQQVTAPLLLREGQYVGSGQTLFTVYTNHQLLAEFAIPPHWATAIAKGKKILFRSIDEPTHLYQGVIALVQPTVNAGENFAIARVYFKDTKLPVGQLLKGTLAFVEDQGYWLPKTAVVSLGNNNIVFKQEGNAFRPTPVSIGIRTRDEVQVLSDIASWHIARDGAYLIDSEDFIIANKY